jgi:hypothetical protein
VLLSVFNTQSTAGLRCDAMTVEYTHTHTRRMPQHAGESVLYCPRRRHPDANVFRWLQQRFRETGSEAPTTLLNAGRPRSVRIPMTMP